MSNIFKGFSLLLLKFEISKSKWLNFLWVTCFYKGTMLLGLIENSSETKAESAMVRGLKEQNREPVGKEIATETKSESSYE